MESSGPAFFEVILSIDCQDPKKGANAGIGEKLISSKTSRTRTYVRANLILFRIYLQSITIYNLVTINGK